MDFKKGDHFHAAFKVDNRVYEQFIQLFNDKNPLHTEEDFARSKGFHGKVMHGNILHGFISYFVGECLPVKNVIIQAQSIKFSKPVYLGDELNFSAVVDEVFESVNTVEFKYFFENSLQEKVAKGTIQIGLLA